MDYLTGVTGNTVQDNFLRYDDEQPELKLDDFIQPLEHKETILNLLQSRGGVNILLYGAPGTGKSEFARTIIHSLGQKGFFVRQVDEDGDESLDHRKRSIVAAKNLLNPKESIVIVDESDTLLSSRQNSLFGMQLTDDRKAWINKVLENNQHKVIWISNSIDGIDPSTKRRFSFSLQFLPLTTKQRERVWRIQLQKLKINFLTDNDIKQFAQRYQINAGGIALALTDLKQMKSMRSVKQKKKMLEMLLEQHTKFVFGSPQTLTQLNRNYSLDVVNADCDLQQVIDSLGQFYQLSESVEDSPIVNFNLLLQGVPGTGKTEFVKYVAEQLERPLLVKRLSDIRSKWYGESLKNIAAMFREAEQMGAILFLDEADSFFQDRSAAHQYAAEETNELLTQMENFRGVMFCSTNFVDNLDPATMRRFNQKIKFSHLTNKAKELLFNSILKTISKKELSSQDRQSLANL
jgi:SpoVK/Ycf46/Vps4 family AAA+-type ATPase